MLAVDRNIELESRTPLDLSTIANGFPALKHLKVVSPSPPAGSLKTLKHLESLEITLALQPDDPDMDFGLDESVLDILPRESAETLTSVTIGHGLLPDCMELDLTPYRNLRHFTCEAEYEGDGIVTPEFRCLEKVEAYLESFEFIGKLPKSIFAHPCFSRLRALTVRGPFRPGPPELDVDYVDLCMDRIAEMTETWQYLHHIVFVHVGMDVTKLQCLSRLRNLKSITWDVGWFQAYVHGGRGVEQALAKAFESFEVKPRIEVVGNDPHYSYGYGSYGYKSRWPQCV
jgi:hypothetical protein